MEAVKSGALLQVKFDHDVLGDLTAFGGPVLQAGEAVLHLGDAALEASGQGLVGTGCPDDGGEDLVQLQADELPKPYQRKEEVSIMYNYNVPFGKTNLP
jgi:hypothetical protein